MRLAPIAVATLLATSALSAQSPAAPGSPALDAAARRRIVDSAARVLESHYVDADTATLIARRLRARLAAGAYDAFDAPDALGAAMMRDLQQVVPDKHLRVSWEPGLEYSLTAPPSGTAATPGVTVMRRIDPRDAGAVARTNFEFRRLERFPGNVGYLQLDRFVP